MITKHTTYVSVFVCIAAVSMSLIGQPAFADYDHRGWKPRTLWVNCAYRTIGSALKRHRTKTLVIIVKGTCDEDVVIDRNHVTLVAATPQVDGIISQAADGAAVTVSGAQGVVIDGLRLQSKGGGSPAGLFVTRNGEATIQNALIDNNAYGIWANHGGFFLVRHSDVVDNTDYGIFLTDGGNARIQDSTIEGNSAAIGAFRGINLRLRGINVIGKKADGGSSLELFHSVDLRQDGGHTIFNGPMEFGNLTNASLRDPEIIGGVGVFGGSRVEIRNSSMDPDELTGGDINVSSNSRLAFTRPGIVANVGSITVDEFSSLILGDYVSVRAEGDMKVNGSRFTMAHNSSIVVVGDGGLLGGSGGLAIEDFSVMFANNFTNISAEMHFGGSVAKVNLFGSNVVYTGNMFFSPSSSLDFGSLATIDGTIHCGGGDVFFESPPVFISGGFDDCNVFLPPPP